MNLSLDTRWTGYVTSLGAEGNNCKLLVMKLERKGQLGEMNNKEFSDDLKQREHLDDLKERAYLNDL
jgi:hypothetical protein